MSDDLHDATKIGELLGAAGREVGQVFELLVQRGLAGAFPRRLGDSYTHEAGLKAPGKALKSEWIAAQTPGRTKMACMAAMLSWLDARDGETIAETDTFACDARSYFFGLPFAPETVVAAARELKDQGLITGTWGGPVLRPAITNLGKVVLTRHGGDLVEWEASKQAGGTNVSVNGSTGINIATNSPGLTQTITVTSTSEQVLNLAAALEQMLPILQLDEAQYASATDLVAQLRNAVPEAETNPSKLRALLGMVRDIGINAAGGAAGSGLVLLVEQVAHHL